MAYQLQILIPILKTKHTYINLIDTSETLREMDILKMEGLFLLFNTCFL